VLSLLKAEKPATITVKLATDRDRPAPVATNGLAFALHSLSFVDHRSVFAPDAFSFALSVGQKALLETMIRYRLDALVPQNHWHSLPKRESQKSNCG
jgi:hypothetical protein